MKKLLTIAIPTFNRAALLDKQLDWFSKAVKGNEYCCELIVTDNCSTDSTPDVIDRWKTVFEDRNISFHINRQPGNVGAIRNIAYCINHANGEFVWTVSDDDSLSPDSLRFVLKAIEENAGLFLLILNFSSRHWRTRKLRYERCFEVESDEVIDPGKELFERWLNDPNPSRWGGLALTTVLIYRTDAAQSALNEWREGLDNLTCQLYITAYCALLGKTILTKQPYVEMAGGRHFFTSDRMMFLRFRLAEIPEAFFRLAELGYSRDLCEQKILNQRAELTWPLFFQNLSRGPLATVRVLKRYLVATKAIKKCRPKNVRWRPSTEVLADSSNSGIS